MIGKPFHDVAPQCDWCQPPVEIYANKLHVINLAKYQSMVYNVCTCIRDVKLICYTDVRTVQIGYKLNVFCILHVPKMHLHASSLQQMHINAV